MGLVSSRKSTGGAPLDLQSCPVCNELLTRDQAKVHGDHFRTQVVKIESGEAAGKFTWRCSCGPANMYWPDDFKALAGLCVHLQQKHAMHNIF
jgi:hypothetical protein